MGRGGGMGVWWYGGMVVGGGGSVVSWADFGRPARGMTALTVFCYVVFFSATEIR